MPGQILDKIKNTSVTILAEFSAPGRKHICNLESFFSFLFLKEKNRALSPLIFAYSERYRLFQKLGLAGIFPGSFSIYLLRAEQNARFPSPGKVTPSISPSFRSAGAYGHRGAGKRGSQKLQLFSRPGNGSPIPHAPWRQGIQPAVEPEEAALWPLFCCNSKQTFFLTFCQHKEKL